MSLRQWRRETLIRYSNANQSEPLRILLTFLLGLSLTASSDRSVFSREFRLKM